MEAGDGFLGARDHRLLTRDGAHVRHSGIEQLGIAGSNADAHVDHDLGQTRNLVDVVDCQIFFKLGHDFLGVLFLQTRSSHVAKTFPMI